MKTFFICCGVFLLMAWIILACEHGENAGHSMLDTFNVFFEEGDDE